MLDLLKLEMSLSLVMNVPSLCVGLAMSTRGKMELSAARNARLDSDDTGVSCLFLLSFLAIAMYRFTVLFHCRCLEQLFVCFRESSC